MQRPDTRELLLTALQDIEDMPEGLGNRLLEVVDAGGDQVARIRAVFEEALDG